MASYIWFISDAAEARRQRGRKMEGFAEAAQGRRAAMGTCVHGPEACGFWPPCTETIAGDMLGHSNVLCRHASWQS